MTITATRPTDRVARTFRIEYLGPTDYFGDMLSIGRGCVTVELALAGSRRPVAPLRTECLP